MKARVLPWLLTLIFVFSLGTVNAQEDAKTAQTVIHLLSYVSKDYAVAVQDGKIISPSEYSEQTEFVGQAIKMTTDGHFLTGKEKAATLSAIEQLNVLVNGKKPAEKISTSANAIIDNIIRLTGLKTAPKLWPDLAQGRTLFAKNCAMCHGKAGGADGPMAKALDPMPTNFQDLAVAEHLTSYQAFSSIKLGVPGTAMVAFSHFDDQQKWALAFYVKTLRYTQGITDSLKLRQAFKEAYAVVNLDQVATWSDIKLHDSLQGKVSDPNLSVKALRLLMPTADVAASSLGVAREKLAAAYTSYVGGQKTLARTQAVNAYLEGIEPVEAQLKTQNSDFVLKLEEKMFAVRQAIAKDAGADVLKTRIAEANTAIDEAQELMQGEQLNYWLSFLIAASIMLREGLEAFLVLAVVLALIRRADAKKALPWLHGGWISAVLLGVAGWFLSDYILQFGGKNREIMEGLVALLAVVVLLFVGFWLHNKTYAQQWKAFIEDKINVYLKNDRMIGLAAFSFMVVFREVFEVILFLQALNLEVAEGDKSAIGLGVLAAVVGIALIAYVFLKYSKMIPVRKLFLYSSWIIVFLAIVLTGKGIHALQESGWISVNSIQSMFRLDWLGIYNTVETLIGQLLLIAIIVATYLINKRRVARLVLQKEKA